jgi:hypothetical protein
MQIRDKAFETTRRWAQTLANKNLTQTTPTMSRYLLALAFAGIAFAAQAQPINNRWLGRWQVACALAQKMHTSCWPQRARTAASIS